MQEKKTKKKGTTSTKKTTKTTKKTTTNTGKTSKKVTTKPKKSISSSKKTTSGRKKRKSKRKIDLKKKILIFGSILFVVFVIVLGNSFALLSGTVQGTKVGLIKTSTYDVIFEDGSEYIKLNNVGPESDEDGLKNNSYKFTLTNNGNINVESKIYFSDIESTIPTQFLKYAIKENDNYIVLGETFETNSNVIKDSVILEPNDSITYEITFWISSDADNSIMNTTYKSKVTVDTVQE